MIVISLACVGTEAFALMHHTHLAYGPKIFCAMAVGLLWSMYELGVSSVLHYLVFALPGTDECASNLSLALTTWRDLAEHKLKGPTTNVLAFLGIKIDTVPCVVLASQQDGKFTRDAARVVA